MQVYDCWKCIPVPSALCRTGLTLWIFSTHEQRGRALARGRNVSEADSQIRKAWLRKPSRLLSRLGFSVVDHFQVCP